MNPYTVVFAAAAPTRAPILAPVTAAAAPALVTVRDGNSDRVNSRDFTSPAPPGLFFETFFETLAAAPFPATAAAVLVAAIALPAPTPSRCVTVPSLCVTFIKPGTKDTTGMASLSFSNGGNTFDTRFSTTRNANRTAAVAASKPATHTKPPANCMISVAKKENAMPKHNPRVITGAAVSNTSTTAAVTQTHAESRWYRVRKTLNAFVVASTPLTAYRHVNGMHTKFNALSPAPVRTVSILTATTALPKATPTFAAKYATAESTSSAAA
mmetsp:Transcript_3369/g.12519  ORF Transcript_3369/g.12519 Transcript_3369/m.12519 type:complete len:269 (-) Transcript_3369:570-1376(-)